MQDPGRAEDGTIKNVKMTFDGVKRKLKGK